MDELALLTQRVAAVRERMAAACAAAHRPESSVLLCAASKTQTPATVALAAGLPIDLFGENRVQEISEITRNLKIMAKELNVPVIALSQLSRSAEKNRTDHRPVLSDLRDSGSIEQDADVVLFLYRDAYYDNGEETDATTAECIVAKNRHGEVGKVDLGWDGAHTRFTNVDYAHG